MGFPVCIVVEYEDCTNNSMHIIFGNYNSRIVVKILSGVKNTQFFFWRMDFLNSFIRFERCRCTDVGTANANSDRFI